MPNIRTDMRWRTIAASLLLAALTTPAIGADKPGAGSVKESQQGHKGGKASDKTIPEPKDCEQVASGTFDRSAQSAARKDCEASQHLGAGTGTSSGTGSGKMQSGSGPR
jgi:hypothetical protein